MTQAQIFKLFFSDYFGIDKKTLNSYGAFDISLAADLPLFIDPFLLFQSQKPEYKQLHSNLINYLKFLRDYSLTAPVDPGRLKSLFYFSEVKQNYLGFTFIGNSGRGLGGKFAHELNLNLSRLFSSFGEEKITLGTHLEKLCLISRGVGRDMISDFVTNLIKEYLLEYTQTFTLKNIDSKHRMEVPVSKVKFRDDLGVWIPKTYTLPIYNNDYVILTPKDLLTRDDTWISRSEYYSDFIQVVQGSTNQQLQADLSEYFKRVLKKDYKWRDFEKAIDGFTLEHPELIDYFIRTKEDSGDKAVERSVRYVEESELLFINQFGSLIQFLFQNTPFYKRGYQTKTETHDRILYLKDAIENKGCWKIFYNKDKPIAREEDLHVLFRLVWFRTELDVSSEVNDGRGPVDFKVSYGEKDKTLVEFKLASNTRLRDNLQNQLEIYKKASGTEQGFKVIIYFSDKELEKVNSILKELNMQNDPNIILIDARPKASASKV